MRSFICAHQLSLAPSGAVRIVVGSFGQIPKAALLDASFRAAEFNINPEIHFAFTFKQIREVLVWDMEHVYFMVGDTVLREKEYGELGVWTMW